MHDCMQTETAVIGSYLLGITTAICSDYVNPFCRACGADSPLENYDCNYPINNMAFWVVNWTDSPSSKSALQ